MRNSRLTRERDVEMAYQELFDVQTHLAKPALVRDRLEIALARATRRDRLVGILFVSVDVPADLLPRNVRALDPVQLIAGRLRSAVRPEDTVGRMGECEFVAIVNDLFAPADVDAIEQRLRDVLGVRVYLDESRSVLSVAVETRIGRPGDRAFELLAR